MIYALIAIAWLGVMTLCWAACAMAARADGERSGHAAHRRARQGLVVWDDLPELTVPDAPALAHGTR
jgi:hypothetical protein